MHSYKQKQQTWSQIPLNCVGNDSTCDHSCHADHHAALPKAEKTDKHERFPQWCTLSGHKPVLLLRSFIFHQPVSFQNTLKLNLDNPLVPELHALNSFRVRHEAVPHSQPPASIQHREDFKKSCRYLNFQLSCWTSCTKVVIYLNGSYWFEPWTFGAAQQVAVRSRARGKSQDENARRGANDYWLDVWRSEWGERL